MPNKSASLFRLPGYPAWFGADTFLLAGSAVHWVVIALVAFELSGSVALAGWFSTVRGVTSVVTQVVGGTFIDRHDHRKLILVQAGSCAIIWAVMGALFCFGLLSFWLFAGLCLCSSAIFGFLGGTTNAALIRVVGPSRYAQAESLNQGRDAAVNMAVSPLGAALYGVAQAGPFFASAVCDLLAFVSALFLRIPDTPPGEDGPATGSPASGGTTTGALEEPGPTAPDDSEKKVTSLQQKRASFTRDLVEGWRWVLASSLIMGGVVIVGLSEFGQYAIMQAVNLNLVSQGTDPLLISAVNVGAGIATIVGSYLSTRLCDRIPVGRGIVAILVLEALSYLPMALLGSYGSCVLSMALARLPVPLFSALLLGFLFSKTPIDRQGRTRAAIMTTLMLFGSASGGLAGELLPRIGFGGFVAAMQLLLVVAALLAVGNKRISALPASPEWKTIGL